MRRIILLASMLATSGSLRAQTLADHANRMRDGALVFHFAAREGVCGDGETYVRVNRSYMGSWNGRSRKECVAGPVQVRITKTDGAFDRVEAWVGPLHARDGRDIGAVSAPQAAKFLLGLAGGGLVGAKAIMPAVLADSAVVWPDLLAIARDNQRSRNSRQDAMFWLSRFAAGAIQGKPNALLDDDDHTGEDDVKTHAVFVLSQLPRNEGVPAMLEAARTNKSWEVRSAALFWLGQSGDPRAVDLFESLLRK